MMKKIEFEMFFVWIFIFVFGCTQSSVLDSKHLKQNHLLQSIKRSEVQCANKASMDLRDRPLTDLEWEDISDQKVSLDSFVDSIFKDPVFATTVSHWFQEMMPPNSFTTSDIDPMEPVRIASYLVTNDEDFRLLVTAPFTIEKNGTLTKITDHPSAGILTTRHSLVPKGTSYSRIWAGRIIRSVLATKLNAVTNANQNPDTTPGGVKTNPLCKGCHADEHHGVDMIASFSFCFDGTGKYINGCQETEGMVLNEKAMGMKAFGDIVANSSEFKSFAVGFFFEKLFGRKLAKVERPLYDRVSERFVESHHRAKTIIKEIILSEEYCTL